MNDSLPYGHRKVPADEHLELAGGVYHGGVLLATSINPANVEVYDGVDTTGDLLDAFYCAASNRDVHVFERGIVIRRGLYVNIGSNVSSFSVHVEPRPQPR